MSGACPSALWGDGYATGDNGPNCASSKGDDMPTCGEVQTAMGGAARVSRMGMSCWTGQSNDREQGARSMHSAGVNVCLCDGSVRFVSDFVQLGTPGNPPACLGVWDKLKLSNDGGSFDARQF
jgi:prepilin-type processing-associated H-X9-DG protein